MNEFYEFPDLEEQDFDIIKNLNNIVINDVTETLSFRFNAEEDLFEDRLFDGTKSDEA